MDQLKGRGEGQNGRRCAADGLVGRDGQDRPHALSPGEQAVAHGFMQIRRRRGLGRHDRFKKAVHVLPFLLQVLLDIHAEEELNKPSKESQRDATEFLRERPGLSIQQEKYGQTRSEPWPR